MRPNADSNSQDKYGMVAAGWVTCYLRIVARSRFREKLWDHAAGYVIVTEAGGRMTDIHGQSIDWTAGRAWSTIAACWYRTVFA